MKRRQVERVIHVEGETGGERDRLREAEKWKVRRGGACRQTGGLPGQVF